MTVALDGCCQKDCYCSLEENFFHHQVSKQMPQKSLSSRCKGRRWAREEATGETVTFLLRGEDIQVSIRFSTLKIHLQLSKETRIASPIAVKWSASWGLRRLAPKQGRTGGECGLLGCSPYSSSVEDLEEQTAEDFGLQTKVLLS